jgi:diguanylate cyclase (GGDEF)-like protein/PAS domain S-box-containing protein
VSDSESIQITEALKESEARLAALVSSLDDLVFELDSHGTYLGIWTTNDALLVAPRDQLLGSTLVEALGDEIAVQLRRVMRNVLKSGLPEISEYRLEVPVGVRWFQSRIAPIVLPDGGPPRLCLLVRDITAQKESEREIARLLSRERLLSRLSEALPVGLVEIDTGGRVVFTNEQIRKITGRARLESILDVVVAKDRPALEAALKTVLRDEPVNDLELRLVPAGLEGTGREDRERLCDLSLRALTDGSGTVTGAVGCLSDVTDRIQMRRELEVRASVDKLTSCLNRHASLELLERITSAPKRPGEGDALIFVDVDRLKMINDRYGHAAGDRLLDTIGGRLLAAARRGDSVGRVGGDEFIVICPRVGSPAQALAIAKRVAEATEVTVEAGNSFLELRTSVGVAWTSEALDADAFLAQADSAMYASKRARRRHVTLFALEPTGPTKPVSPIPPIPLAEPLVGDVVS